MKGSYNMIEIYYRLKGKDDNYIECECFDTDTIKEAKLLFNKSINRNKEYVITETRKIK